MNWVQTRTKTCKSWVMLFVIIGPGIELVLLPVSETPSMAYLLIIGFMCFRLVAGCPYTGVYNARGPNNDKYYYFDSRTSGAQLYANPCEIVSSSDFRYKVAGSYDCVGKWCPDFCVSLLRVSV